MIVILKSIIFFTSDIYLNQKGKSQNRKKILVKTFLCFFLSCFAWRVVEEG